MKGKDLQAELDPRGGVATESHERRLIFNGAPGTAPQAGEPAPRVNRAAKRRRRSTVGRIGVLMLVSALVVFYVWNKITVNRLLVEVNDLENQYQKLQATNDVLRAEINRKASLERVGTLAPKYGLVVPKQQPVWFEVPAEDFERMRGRE